MKMFLWSVVNAVIVYIINARQKLFKQKQTFLLSEARESTSDIVRRRLNALRRKQTSVRRRNYRQRHDVSLQGGKTGGTAEGSTDGTEDSVARLTSIKPRIAKTIDFIIYPVIPTGILLLHSFQGSWCIREYHRAARFIRVLIQVVFFRCTETSKNDRVDSRVRAHENRHASPPQRARRKRKVIHSAYTH